MKPKHVLLYFFMVSHAVFAQDLLQHECGLALVRLRKPVTYYQEKYNDIAWGIHKLCILMEKQRNRGQDGVGFSVMQFDMPSGQSFMKRCRSSEKNALEHLFAHITNMLAETDTIPEGADDLSIKQRSRIIGEVYLGHLRYATHGGNSLKFSQPYRYKNSIPAKCLMLAGNFNMTNSVGIMRHIVSQGLAPSNKADTHLIINQISYCLDKAYEQALSAALTSTPSSTEACQIASDNLDIASAIRLAAAHWDGGYVFAGMVGNGDAFICRDPAGIRPGYYYVDEEIFAAASERSTLMNAFKISPEKVKEIPPAHLIVIKKDGSIEQHQFITPLPAQQCMFERIYFSRPNDPGIYQERKALGKMMARHLFQDLKYDVSTSVFCYIPHTSEISFYGLIEELHQLTFQRSYNRLVQAEKNHLSEREIIKMVQNKIRVEKLIFKDQVIRTFIANDTIRSNLVESIFDVTRGVISEDDTLIAFDDSIVRGTTLRQSLLKQLITLNPKKIIVLSAAPIIMYPDCYGIDMSQIGKLIGFQAAIELTKERDNQSLIDGIYKECLALRSSSPLSCYNPIKKLYDQFTQQELEEKIAELIYPHDSSWGKELKVMYQTIDEMHQAIPGYTGDWYFTGNYPTPGGYRVVINSFINWYNSNSERAY